MLHVLFIKNQELRKMIMKQTYMTSTCFPFISSRKIVLQILFMKKADDDDHEIISTCFPSVSSRKHVAKILFLKKADDHDHELSPMCFPPVPHFMKKGDDKDHETSSTCFLSMLSRKGC